METLDWIVVWAYVAAMIGLSVYLGRGQKSDTDYYVGGRDLPWWAVGISVVATQSSAISFISIPAFVALREGGGIKWLSYELAVPLAMIFIMMFLVPYFRKLQLVSVFEFVEMRFGKPTSQFLGVVYLASRGFGTGVGVYATALVLSAMLEMNLSLTILLIGAVAIIYDTIGGIKAVVFSDVIQMVLIVAGAGIAIWYGIELVGGVDVVFSSLSSDRLTAIEWDDGLGSENTAPFWAFLIGGFFLYSSYYGTDQGQVQRALSTKSPRETRNSLLLNGLARFPLTLLYLSLGLVLAATYKALPELQAAIPSDHLDYLLPKFILLYLPAGIKGLILSGILAAAMSSLDSAINSLSAVTMRDYIEKHFDLDEKRQLRWGKATTIGWGLLVTLFAFGAGGIDKTVIEAINKIGSAFYGPVLATFFLGVISRKMTGMAMCVGVIVGVTINMSFWVLKAPIHWMWWNAVGFFVAVFVAYGLSMLLPQVDVSTIKHKPRCLRDIWREERAHLGFYMILLSYFFVILATLVSTYVIFS